MARPQRSKGSEPVASPAAVKTGVLPTATMTVPATPPLFHPDAAADAAGLEASLRTILRGHRERSEVDPFGDPILMTALDLTRRMDKGEASPSAVEQLVQRLTATAFADRAARIGAYVGETDPEANADRIRSLIRSLAQPEPGAPPVPFERFRAAVERWHYGVVFTAHPTFSTSLPVSRLMAQLGAGRDLDGRPLEETQRQALLAEAAAAEHRPPADLTLNAEHAWACEALANAQAALEKIHALVLEVARDIYPADWRRLVPRLISLATWVGYDHDGRADISWADTLRLRLTVKLLQLRRHRRVIAGLVRDPGDTPAAPMLELADSLLALAAKQTEDQIAAAREAAGNPAEAQRFARALVGGQDNGLTDSVRLVRLVSQALEATADEAQAARLSVLRASLAGHGLGLAHSHFRLNSTQLHNAIRKQVGMETGPDDPTFRRSYINAINDLIEQAQPVSINVGSLIAEQASAKRMFMMIAELAKHIDAETPIRFLIAETESAFTLLVALYYARLFGLEERLEISPLFETITALERGDQIIEEALRSPHYRAYVRRTGKLCVQFGFSDSGRYIGQTAATFWIERLRMRIAAVLNRHGLDEVQVILFNTHGESIGRGGHPVSMADRLRYLAPPVSRAEFAGHGIALKEESSFQGGDGYVYFLQPDLAFASLARILESVLGPEPEAANDPIYAAPDYATEFFAAVKQYFSDLVEDPNYAALLGVYGTNMLYRTGSRPVKRQHDWGRPADLSHPSQLRAIPNNGVLQQMGLLANTLGGLGRATAKEPEQFCALRRSSPRFARAMQMVEWAASVSDLDVLRAYVDSLDPGMWLNRAGRTKLAVRREELKNVAAHLERLDLHARLSKVYRHLQADQLALRDSLRLCAASSGKPLAGISDESREVLILLHSVRVALMHRVLLLATHIPDFSPQHGLTFEELFARIVRLDIEPVTDLLEEIFPDRHDNEAAGLDFGEAATYQGGVGQTYEQEHEKLFRPMRKWFELIRRIGTAITYEIGAVG